MKPLRKLLAACGLSLALVACDSPEKTVSATSHQIAEFQAAPDAAKQAEIEASLVRLDAQVEALAKKGDRVQADLFRRQAQSLRSDFQAAKMARALKDAKTAIEGIGQAFQEAGKTIGETFRSAPTNKSE
jgi:uncharacterized protein YukE